MLNTLLLMTTISLATPIIFSIFSIRKTAKRWLLTFFSEQADDKFFAILFGHSHKSFLATQRPGQAGMWGVTLVFLGALFVGQILVPQTILYFVPQLSFLFSNPNANISLGFLSVNILGFIVTGAITLPLLIILLRRTTHSTNIGAQG